MKQKNTDRIPDIRVSSWASNYGFGGIKMVVRRPKHNHARRGDDCLSLIKWVPSVSQKYIVGLGPTGKSIYRAVKLKLLCRPKGEKIYFTVIYVTMYIYIGPTKYDLYSPHNSLSIGYSYQIPYEIIIITPGKKCIVR